MECPNCGRPLEEGEVCNCINDTPLTQPEAPQPAAEIPVPEPAQEAQPINTEAQYTQTANTVPPYAQPPYYAPTAAPQGEPYSNQYYIPSGAPQFTPKPRTDYPEDYKPKRKYAAVLLAASLGGFGIHNFYLGYKNKALTQLLICIIGSLFFGIGIIAAWVWAIVDAVELLCDKQDRDADGFKIQTFEEALVAERLRAEREAKENEQ